ncbi:hypothetical protein ACFL2U_03410 [Patescibacteria group bacterium]
MFKNKTNLTKVLVLVGILVLLFYIAVMLYYYQQFLFFPKDGTQTIEQSLRAEIEQLKNSLKSTDESNQVKTDISLEAANISPENAQEIINDKAALVVSAMEKTKFDDLASLVHPQKGVRFSPYAYVNQEDIIFSPEHLKTFAGNNFIYNTEKYPWGSYDGSGEPIELTFEEYFYNFIYDKYYSNADYVLYNQSISHGNTINNAFEFYSNSIVVEYYFAPVNPRYGKMDWSALRLVFEEYNDTWYLIGIIHDEWTI